MENTTNLIHLGKRQDKDYGSTVTVQEDDMRGNTLILGSKNSGKSALMANLAVQDIQRGSGLIFFASNMEVLRTIISHIPKEREDDLVLIDPMATERQVGIPLFEKVPAAQVPQKAGQLLQVLDVMNSTFDRMHWDMFAPLLFDERTPQVTLHHMRYLLENSAMRTIFLEALYPEGVPPYTEIASPKLYLLDRCSQNSVITNIFGQAKSTVDLKPKLHGNGIVLVHLPLKPYNNFDSQFFWHTLMNAYLLDPETARTHKKRLYIDDIWDISNCVQPYFHAANTNGIDCVYSVQNLYSFSDEARVTLLSSSPNKIVFSTSRRDAELIMTYNNAEYFYAEKDNPFVGNRPGTAHVFLEQSTMHDSEFVVLTPDALQFDEKRYTAVTKKFYKTCGTSIEDIEKEKYAIWKKVDEKYLASDKATEAEGKNLKQEADDAFFDPFKPSAATRDPFSSSLKDPFAEKSDTAARPNPFDPPQ